MKKSQLIILEIFVSLGRQIYCLSEEFKPSDPLMFRISCRYLIIQTVYNYVVGCFGFLQFFESYFY